MREPFDRRDARQPRPVASLCLCAVLCACAPPPAPETPPVTGDRMLARVDGAAIWTSDVTAEARSLGLAAPGETLSPADPRFHQAIDERIDEILLAREAARRGIDRPPVVRRRLAAAAERLRGDLLLRAEVAKAASEPRIDKLYADLASTEAGERPSLAVARPRIVRFLSYQAVKDLILSLRQNAKVESAAPFKAPASAPPA